MNIELHGAGFSNKGAELMLRTCMKKLSQRIPNAKFFVAASHHSPPSLTLKSGIGYIWPSKILEGKDGKFPVTFKFTSWLSEIVPQKLVNSYGLCLRKDIDAFVDISGYAFGDEWGCSPVRKLETLTKYYFKRGKPVILMPQMFGPFNDNKVRTLFLNSVLNSNLVYAREPTSLKQASEAVGSDQVRLAPDITIGSSNSVTIPSASDADSDRICFVPNVRCTDSGENPWSLDEYVGFFADAIMHVWSKGFTPCLLVHDLTGGDKAIADEIQQRCETSVKLVSHEDPRDLKRFISGCYALFGSRFHSLVAALSQNVPVVGIGWAHKYGELLTGYHLGEYNWKGTGKFDDCREKLDALLDRRTNTELRKEIETKNKAFLKELDQLWIDVVKTLKA